MWPSQAGWVLFAIPRPTSLFDCANQSVWTALVLLVLLAAPSEPDTVAIQALVQQEPRGRAAQALTNGSVLVVVRKVVMCVLAGAECMARSVSEARLVQTGPVFLRAALLWSSKAGRASPLHRSAWPGRCASAGGENGK